MKSISITECRTCNSKYVNTDKPITLDSQEEVEFVIVTVAKCSQCKFGQTRSVAGPKIPFTGK